MVLFIMLYKVVPTFESVNEILKGDNLKVMEQYSVVWSGPDRSFAAI